MALTPIINHIPHSTCVPFYKLPSVLFCLKNGYQNMMVKQCWTCFFPIEHVPCRTYPPFWTKAWNHLHQRQVFVPSFPGWDVSTSLLVNEDQQNPRVEVQWFCQWLEILPKLMIKFILGWKNLHKPPLFIVKCSSFRLFHPWMGTCYSNPLTLLINWNPNVWSGLTMNLSSMIWGALKIGHPQNQGSQTKNGLVTWVIRGIPMT